MLLEITLTKSGDSWLTHNPHVCDNINAHDVGVYKTNKC